MPAMDELQKLSAGRVVNEYLRGHPQWIRPSSLASHPGGIRATRKPHAAHRGGKETTATGVDINSDLDPVEVWHHLVGEYVQPAEKTSARGHSFQARMHMKKIGEIDILSVTAPPYMVHRPPKKIAGNRDSERVFCSLQLAGSHLIVQDGREILQRPGELAIFDHQYPCTLVCREPVHFLAFVFPRHAVGSDLEALVQGAATILPTDEGIAPLVTSFLRQLGEQKDNVRPTTAVRLADHTLDLLSTFFADLRRTEPSIEGTAQRSLVAVAKAYIDANLADPHLSPAAVATAHHISVRYLQKLFETHELTVSGWIRKRRLERIRRDLADPAQRGVSITVIAHRWGFVDSAHFSRVFKTVHGLSPRDYRHEQLALLAG
jgi:AraC-like DNA-binding protein